MAIGQIAIGPVVLGGAGLGGSYKMITRRLDTEWSNKERVGKPTIHEFISGGKDVVTIEGVIFPLSEYGGRTARLAGAVGTAASATTALFRGPRISELGRGNFGGSGAVALLRRLAVMGRPLPVVMGTGEVCGMWVITAIEERMSDTQADGVARKAVYRITMRYYGMSVREFAQRALGGLAERVRSAIQFGGEVDDGLTEQVSTTITFGGEVPRG